MSTEQQYACGNCGATFTAPLANSVRVETREERVVGWEVSRSSAFLCPACWPAVSHALRDLGTASPPYLCMGSREMARRCP